MKPHALRGFHAALTEWYRAHGRHDLPWRLTDDPYHIWLSEVMLQQTQVATVRDRFYFPFLKKFPTIEALANAELTEVMKAWEGLGYYSRARNLHRAAKIASKGMPRNIEGLLALPGIGKNTAHAILAFVYHQPVAILEANVKRVVARVFALESPNDAQLWAGAETLLNKGNAFDYNQAMMDVGAAVCTPKKPRCSACPAQSICRGKASPEKYPSPKKSKKIPTREVVIHVREDARGRFFLEKRDERLLGGLYGFPQTATHHSLLTTHALGTVTHTYSHFKLTGHVVHEKIASKPNSPDWHTAQEIAKLPLSKLDHKVLALVENCHTAQKKRSKPAPTRNAR